MLKPQLFFLICLFYLGNSFAQADTSYRNGDTLIRMIYHKNGKLQYLDKYIQGRDHYSYHFSFTYYKNGNPKWLNYSDAFLDTSLFYSGRKNGTIKFRDGSNKNYTERIKQNRKGKLIERTLYYYKDKFSTSETYKHGKLISEQQVLKKRIKSKHYIDTVNYYQGQVGGNRMVVEVETNGKMEYIVNGTKMTEAEFIEYNKEFDDYIIRRTPKHLYREFSSDSILIYQGIFKKVDIPCGSYYEYYPNGTIKVRGDYNEKGEKNLFWTYYNMNGLFYKREHYKNGQLQK